ncbi:MAG TPA: Asd/ArgC dimerization domain-containing protein [Candidatus Acidoferrum sp.]|nr:Asd/ArgC dimerization domain-containing protein [Candidatus Acidoferrum sp.]
MPTPLESRRIVIAGASSLLGAELKSLLEESRFAASDFRLVDEPLAAGILTEAGGEPAVIQPVEEDSFDKAWTIFFAGSPVFTQTNLALAKRSGARIIDLSGELSGQQGVHTWLPKISGDQAASVPSSDEDLYAIPSAAGEMIARLSLALDSLHPSALSATAFQPVSAAGKSGIEELESQTGHLLSFQPVGKEIFDTQVAFSMLDRFGSSSAQSLSHALDILRREVKACLTSHAALPAVQLLHAPVFYGATVSACAFLPSHADASAVAQLCKNAGFTLTDSENAPSNVSSAGEISLQLAAPAHDASILNALWFWAAADNIRLPAMNAIKLAESLLS